MTFSQPFPWNIYYYSASNKLAVFMTVEISKYNNFMSEMHLIRIFVI
jgi:hypothetical protein